MSRERYCVFNLTRQSFLSLGVSVADSQWARLRGLIGKLRLRSDEGLWVVPSQGVHTIGLTFPIDVVYLDADSRVVHVLENLRPFRTGPLRTQSRSVLELPTRSVFCSSTQVGDQFLICPPEELAAKLSPPTGNDSGDGAVSPSRPEANTAIPSPESNGHWGSRLRLWVRAFGDRRRSRRAPLPGVAAYYWEGGVPEPHDVLDMSESGAYIRTANSWYPGTIIGLTLQQKIANLDRPSDWRASMTVSARVVRSGALGIGIQFLYTHPGDRLGVKKFLAAMKAGGR